MTWLGIAIVCAVLGWGLIKVGLPPGWLKGLKVAAVVSVLIASLVMGLWATDDTTTATVTAVGGTWSFVHSSGDTAGFSVNNNTTVTGDRSLLVTFLATGGGTVDEGTVNIDYACSRTDTGVQDDVAVLEIVSIGEVVNTTTGISYSIVSKVTTGDGYNTALDDGTTTYQDVLTMNFPSDPSARTDTLGAQLEINPAALDALSSYGTATITLSIDGVQDVITIMRQ